MKKIKWASIFDRFSTSEKPHLPTIKIPSGEIHVWVLSFEKKFFFSPQSLVFLSSEEIQKGNSFKSEKNKQVYFHQKALQKIILSHYLGIPPQEICIQTESHGKPFIAQNPKYPSLHFNTSNSEAATLLAISGDYPLGIDIERIREEIDFEEMVDFIFSKGELDLFNQEEEKNKPNVFFRFWTRKEAYLKALGTGFSSSPNQIDVNNVMKEVPNSNHKYKIDNLNHFILDLDFEIKDFLISLSVLGEFQQISKKDLSGLI